MSYLRKKDFINLRIQTPLLSQITQMDDGVRVNCQQEAIEEVKSYLSERYDVADEMKDIQDIKHNDVYIYNSLINLDAPLYDPLATSYSINDIRVNSTLVYKCKTAITAPEPFTPTKWDLIGNQHDLYSVSVPYFRFNYGDSYYQGDIVIYKGVIYKAIKDSYKVMVNDRNVSDEYWLNCGTFTFTGFNPYSDVNSYTPYVVNTAYTKGQLVRVSNQLFVVQNDNNNGFIGDPYYFVPISFEFKDNRSTQLLGCCIDIALYRINMRIAPNNIPQLVLNNYNNQIYWLTNVAVKNNIAHLNLPKLQPVTARRILISSNKKNTNQY